MTSEPVGIIGGSGFYSLLDDAVEVAYLQTRALLADATKQAAAYLGKGIGKKQLATITGQLGKYLSIMFVK